MDPILVFEDCEGRRPEVTDALRRNGIPFELQDARSDVVEAILAGHPAAVVWALRVHCDSDLGVLRLIRLIRPELPLLLIEQHEARLPEAAMGDLHPTFVGRLPADRLGLLKAVDQLAGLSVPH